MERTVFAQHQAPVAVAARPYADLGICFQWRNVAPMTGFSTNAATKRSARHLGKAPT